MIARLIRPLRTPPRNREHACIVITPCNS